MIKQHGGSIITLSSGMGRAGKAGFGAYSAAKFGIEGLTQVLAAELAPFNIRVNALQPGGIVAVRTILKEKDVDPKICIRADIVRPMAVFLASDDSAGVTGQSLSCAEWNAEHGFGDRSQYLYSP
jgi:NAD(P)-dependent dehydrogenase (short-subunit alcohol dehydrogenase family)